jgi:hypothetical protein
MASTKIRSSQPETPSWMETSSAARLWLSFWPQHEPTIHRLRLTNLKIHPFGIQFETDRELASGTPLEIRLLLPPTTAIALKGTVTFTKPNENMTNRFMTSIRFTTIRESDRKKLDDFTAKRRTIRLRGRCSPAGRTAAAATATATAS